LISTNKEISKRSHHAWLLSRVRRWSIACEVDRVTTSSRGSANDTDRANLIAHSEVFVSYGKQLANIGDEVAAIFADAFGIA
jgi:hypothetical protein